MAVPDLYVRNGRVVASGESFDGGVLVADGRILEVVRGNPDHDAAKTIEASGQLILPGLVDPHVHFSEPGRGHWEGFATGSRAAAAGGITTLIEMPLNASPPTINAGALALKRETARQSIVDYGLWGGLVTDNRGDLSDLHAGGVSAFKAFMCTGSFDFPRADDVVLEGGMVQVAKMGSLVAVHAEDEEMTQRLTADLRRAGRRDRRAWGEARPIIAELSAIRSAIAMAERTGVRLHIVHISCAAGIDLVSAAKRRGVPVTAETCPHYLVFSEDDLERLGPVAKCAPPLRAPAEVEALWQRVLVGAVDVIASDHSPSLWEEKTAGDANIFEAWGGISGLQSTLPALLVEGVGKRSLPLTDLVRMTSTNPARIFGLAGKKGELAPGYDADIVLVDPERQTTLTAENLFYRNRHSAYVGSTLHGTVTRTLLRGLTIFAQGQIMVDAPAGQFLPGAGVEAMQPPKGSADQWG
ncbi:MAG: allantoinase AllB [Candidatus Devosia phytovorans]|uniref:Allantoinase AllB n=1 Tax=Candidatus Devosia phytovorans TaxID=3121372 RepID=A0AAJ5VVF0_9HYPH|nr:allantoinase AllB [Devosia sp.]WEK04620.1 MAG: allantoinase AllB [Devosia sp.]